MFTDLEPASDPRLAVVFSAAKAPAELPLPGEAAALAAYQRSGGRSWWFARRTGARPAQMVAAVLFGGFVVAGGVATAATGSLPVVGHHHATHPAGTTPAATNDDGSQHGLPSGDDGTAGDTDLTDTGGPGTAGHLGGSLGSVATGVAACTAASDGTCQAGQHGKASAAHDQQAAPSPPPAATTHRPAHPAGGPSTVRGPHLVAGLATASHRTTRLRG
jgi:hypothetical protein